MSNTALSQQNTASDEFDSFLRQWEQEWPIREQVSTALSEANAAFAAQFMEPDGYKYIEACDRFARFLNLKLPMSNSEQKSVVQVLQVACAMHENAVNRSTLTAAQRSTHYLASVSLVSLCKGALDGGVTHPEVWCEVFNLTNQAEKAFSKAMDALDLFKYFDITSITNDLLGEPGNGSEEMLSTASKSPPKPTTPKASLHNTDDVNQSPLLAKLKESVRAMLNDRPSEGASKLGHAYTTPALSQNMTGYHPSRTDQMPSGVYSRGHGLEALQEEE